MPSFDVVSTVDMQEITNAVDQTRRELTTRFDFKGSKWEVNLQKDQVELLAQDDMRLKAIQEIFRQKLAKRGISLKSVKFKDAEKAAGDTLRQIVEIRQALNSDELRTLNKLIKQEKFKVTAAIQGDQLRVTGKKRDELQEVIGFLKKNVQDIDLQFVNFRE